MAQKMLLSNLIDEKGTLGTAEIIGPKSGGGGGGGADNAVLYTAQSLSNTQKAQARTNIGAAPTETVQTVSGTDPAITPAANTIYNCGTLDSLTITNPPATGGYSIVFTSGATATLTRIPITVLGLEDFAADANTLYEINILDNRAVVGSWAVS